MPPSGAARPRGAGADARRILGRHRLEHLVDVAFANVDEHVGVGEALHGAHGRTGADLCCGMAVGDFAAEVVFEHLLLGDGRDAVVVELEPVAISLGLEQGKVVTAVQVARVDEDAVQPYFQSSLLSGDSLSM